MKMYKVEGIGELVTSAEVTTKTTENYFGLHVADNDNAAIAKVEKHFQEKGYDFFGRAILVENVDGYDIILNNLTEDDSTPSLYLIAGIGKLDIEDMAPLHELYIELHVAENEENAVVKAEEKFSKKGSIFYGNATQIANIDDFAVTVCNKN